MGWAAAPNPLMTAVVGGTQDDASCTALSPRTRTPPHTDSPVPHQSCSPTRVAPAVRGEGLGGAHDPAVMGRRSR